MIKSSTWISRITQYIIAVISALHLETLQVAKNFFVYCIKTLTKFLDGSDNNTPDERKDSTIDQLNYLNRSQSYVKCGDTDKMLNTNDEEQKQTITASSSNNNNNTQGYETPVMVKRVKTPTNECPQYYTDMAAGSRK